MGVWSTIKLEGYCMYRYLSEKKHVYYSLKPGNKFKIDKKSAKTEKNEGYVPPSKRPKWCIKRNKGRIPRFECLAGFEKEEGKCPFFAYCEGDRG